MARNDFNDIHHLLYIMDDNIIVTDDGMFNTYLSDFYPKNIISSNDFRNLL
ncbi:hypothetical protein AGMMS4952_27730 [Spirochaetia bacterium]|nr:hypothetical protein AGMMS4952_27730 [Spirochaetia bacterium]